MSDKKPPEMAPSRTETVDSRFRGIDQWKGDRILGAILDSQEGAVASIRPMIPVLEAAAEEAAKRLDADEAGRIIYIGAGTPARLAVQDGSELTPTYGWPALRLAFVIAGGAKALVTPVEGAEDDAEDAKKLIEDLKLTASDVCIAVSASGVTPFTVAACAAARAKGALTVGIASNDSTPLLNAAEHKVFLDSGPEPVAGSTRMGAGTAQKVALNMFSTLTMIRLGRVYDGYMVDVELTNAKLRRRAERIVGDITGCSDEHAASALLKSSGSVKLAVLVAKGYSVDDSKKMLEDNNGNLRRVMDRLAP
jgi:N-acetylmuramic acid 6-phosphate etherase